MHWVREFVKQSKAMTSLASVVVLLLFASAIMGQHIGTRDNSSELVSFIALVANPSAYDGQQISTMGVLDIGDGEHALFLTKEHLEYGIYQNALSINFSESNFSEEALTEVDGKYVIIEGHFDVRETGHVGLLPAGLTRINRISSSEFPASDE